jgi:F0F1-type ATP synthase assembly protein I
MGLIILLGALAGKYLDRYFKLQTPVFTLVLSLVSVFAALYISLKDFLFKGK